MYRRFFIRNSFVGGEKSQVGDELLTAATKSQTRGKGNYTMQKEVEIARR